MVLLELIEEKIIKIPLESDNKLDVINELTGILADAGKIKDIDPVVEVLLSREDQGSTGLGGGLAIPHGQTSAVDSLTIAIGIAPEGIDFDSLDGEPATIFFLILVPPDQSGSHLQALSEIAGITKSREFCSLLLASSSAVEAVKLFKEE